MSKSRLWVRPEVLELGIVPIIPPQKVSLKMLSRLLEYTKEMGDKGEKGYPKLSYDAWKHIAVKKMDLSVECAMVVFFTCLLFSQMESDTLEKFEVSLASNPPQKVKDEAMSQMKVWTLELIILLYLHRISTTHPRAAARQLSLQSLTTDPWPLDNESCSISKQLLEEQNSNFIKQSIPELLTLLSGNVQDEESRKKNKKTNSPEMLFSCMKLAGVLDTDVVTALGFIIGASMPLEKKEISLIELATEQSSRYQSGYLSKKNAFQIGLFKQWILDGLDWAPHGEWLCIRKGRRKNWPFTSLTQSHPKILASPSSGMHSLYLVSDLNDGVIVVEEDSMINDLKIRRCYKSNIYALHPLRNVTIYKSNDCKIIIGPTKGRVKIIECKNTVVTCPARSVVIYDSKGITLHTLVPIRPLLVGTKTDNITLGPLNIHYSKLRNQMSAVGLQNRINLWNRPLHIGPDGTVISGACEIMSPEDFNLDVIPFSDVSSPLDGRPPLVPPGLPSLFIKSIETARKNVSSFRNEVEESNLTPEQKIKLQKAIDARFKKWLKENGKQRELDQFENFFQLFKD